MSFDYDMYLIEHKMNVMRGFKWLVENVFKPEYGNYERDMPRFVITAASIIGLHDSSKHSKEEYPAYDDYFYGGYEDGNPANLLIDRNFNHAWLHHQYYNKHHWPHV